MENENNRKKKKKAERRLVECCRDKCPEERLLTV